MTTIAATNAGVFNDLSDVNSYSGWSIVGSQTATSFGFESAGDTRVIFTGVSFGSWSGNFSTTGTIDSMDIFEWNGASWVQTAAWTNVGADASVLSAAIANSDHAAGDATFLAELFGENDTMNGENEPGFDDVLNGYGGDDFIRTFNGDDTVHGGDGGDTILADFGTDQVYGDSGDDLIYAFDGTAGDIYDGGAGGETSGDQLVVIGVNTIDLTAASISNFEQLTFDGVGSPPFMAAQILSSQIGGFSSSLTINGSTFSTEQVHIVMDGTTLDISGWQIGSNWLATEQVRISGTSGADTITGWEGSDDVGGGQGADTVHTGAGNDSFYGTAGGDGNDQMYGGDGDDRYGVFDLGDVIHEVNGEGTADLANIWVDNYVLGADVERMTLFGDGSHQVFTGTGNSSANDIIGNSLNNTIYGMDGADTIYGDVGNDVLVGGLAGDTLHGDAGNDTASYAGSAAVNVNLGTGAASGGDAAGDVFDSIESLTGSSFNDMLTGDAGANKLNGGSGNDALNGGAGIDNMIGGGGNDIYSVDVAGDVTTEAAAGGTDLVQSSVTRTLGANLEKLTLTGLAAINGTGNSLANTIIGNSAANTLNGGTGADTMKGGGGNDTYIVDSASDLTTELSAGGGVDLVKSSVSRTLGAFLENLTLTGSANINGTGNTLANTITGNSFDNILSGDSGADTLKGGNGADKLNGGLGLDLLTGGLGADTFIFNVALISGNRDTVTDFSVLDDTIKLENAVFTGLAAGALAASRFHIGSNAADASDRVIYDATNGRLYFDADGDGAGAKIQFATLDAGLLLTAADFLVI